MHDENPYVEIDKVEELARITVEALMQQDKKCWDEDLVRDIFSACILGIVLSNSQSDDFWYWRQDKSGCYTVKSGYRHLIDNSLSRNDGAGSNLWCSIWCLHVPPKIKIFLWRAAANILPSLDNLSRKKDLFQRCSYDQRELSAMIMSNLWANRNSVVWRNRKMATRKIVENSVYTSMGSGMVLRNDEDIFIAAKMEKKMINNSDATLAEAISIREALSWIKANGWSNIETESNCLPAVQMLRNRSTIRTSLGMILEDCRRMINEIGSVFISFVGRSTNCVTHTFVRAAISKSS
ncbi:hypothetical protein DITRI_Ditri06bG0145000 [Diplodiscus trichospermus]